MQPPLTQRRDGFAAMPVHRRILLAFALFTPLPVLIIGVVGLLHLTHMEKRTERFAAKMDATLQETALPEAAAETLREQVTEFAAGMAAYRKAGTMTLAVMMIMLLVVTVLVGVLLSRQVMMYIAGLRQGWTCAVTPPQIAEALEQLASLVRQESDARPPAEDAERE